ncbi:MAG: YCF48-related protein [Blastocatellia bacterium]|nr:YCF48-related protein [Blastocatellia bacterium]
MFSRNFSHRNLLGAFALFCGVSLIAAALFFGPSVEAQSTTIPLGTYTGLLPSQVQIGSGTQPASWFSLTLMDGGKFEISMGGMIINKGTFAISQNQVGFTGARCGASETFQWNLQGNKLTFTSVSVQTNKVCSGVLPFITFFRTDQQDSLWKLMGPEGGEIKSLFSYNNKLFAGGARGAGIFVSLDNGQTWKPARGNSVGGSPIYGFAAFNGVLYAGASGGVILVSRDEGETWELQEPSSSPPPNFQATDFTVHNGKLYAAVPPQYIYRLTDNPYVWESAGITGLTSFRINALASLGNSLFAGSNDRGVFLSTDNGNTWASANNGIATAQILTMLVNGTMVYAAAPNEVYVSDNNGQSWKPVGNGLAASFPGTTVTITKLLASGGKLYGASNIGIIVNQGGNWAPLFWGSPVYGFNTLVTHGGQLFAGAYFDGVSRSSDGGATWSQTNKGLTGRSIWGVLRSGGRLYIGSGDGSSIAGDGAFISTNEGQSWTRTNLPPTSVSRFLEFNGKVYAGTGVGLYVTSDQGQSWTPLKTGLPSGALDLDLVGPALYALNPGGGPYRGLYKSTDGGQNWSAINNGLTTQQVVSIAGIGDKLFAGTADKGVFRSDDQGQSWTQASTGLPGGPVFALASSGNTLLATVWGQAIYRSDDNGANWTMAAGGFQHWSAFTLFANNGLVFASGGNNQGVLRTTDRGQNWAMMNQGMDFKWAYRFAATGPTLYATGPAGVYVSNVLINPQTTTSAASYSVSAITEKAIVAAFGPTLATGTAGAATVPLPTSLAGTSVKVRDSNGVERLAPLFYASPDQINYQIPAGTATGPATITIVNNNGIGAMGTVDVKTIAPSIFSADAKGSGPAAAVDAITSAAAPFNATQANGQPNIISVFGTGLGADATDVDGNINDNVTARLDGNVVQLQYAGRSPGLVGLNQFNVILPAGITSGPHTLTITRGGVTSNTTTLVIR